MTLAEFRFIYLWEYVHRLFARLIGLVFLIPFLYFLSRGYLNRPLRLRALALFGLSFVGLGVSMFPYVVPGAVTIWEAAAPDSSLLFMLVGASVLIPIILAYTAYAYWVFRGKVGHEGYH